MALCANTGHFVIRPRHQPVPSLSLALLANLGKLADELGIETIRESVTRIDKPPYTTTTKLQPSPAAA